MSGIQIWSTNPANNNMAAPDGISGTDSPNVIDNVIRQHMADTRTWYNDAQWTDLGDIPTYGSTTSFTISSDVTTTYTMGRKIKLYGSTFGTHTGVILTSTFSSPNTTITVKMDDGVALTSNISQVYLAVPSAKYNALSTWVSSPKNIIIGGNFTNNPWTRGISFTSVANNTYTADRVRWIQSADCVVNVEKVTDSPSIAQCGYYSTSCLRVSVITADASIAAGQYAGISFPIEGYDANQINHQFYTIGIWVKSVKTGIYCAALRNSGADRSYIFEFTINTASTWQYVQLPLAALSSSSAGTWNSTNGLGLELVITMAAGTTYQTTAGAWQSGSFLATSNQVNGLDSTSNALSINFVGIVKGFAAYDWSDENISGVLASCQRYAYKTYDLGVNLQTATLNGAVYAIGNGAAATYLNFPLPVAMRSSTITGVLYSTSTGTAAKFRNQTTAADVDAVIQVNGTKNIIASTTGSPSAGNIISGHAFFTSELT